MTNTAFFVSDGTGITAANLGRSLLSQFDALQFEEITLPYISSVEQAKEAADLITQTFEKTQKRPLVFTTLINAEFYNIVANTPAFVKDLFKTFIGPLEDELGIQSSHTVGKTHGLKNYEDYMTRMNAVNYTLNNDDGVNIHDYAKADVILLGVSRCGKTPTCLYLALQFGLFAANYPLTLEDLDKLALPTCLKPFKHKLIGLTIDPIRLQQIRQERRPNSSYSNLKNCQQEVNEAESLFKKEQIPYLATTTRSIEELAAEIIHLSAIKKRLNG